MIRQVRLTLDIDAENDREACEAFMLIIANREVETLSFEVRTDEDQHDGNGTQWHDVLDVDVPRLGFAE